MLRAVRSAERCLVHDAVEADEIVWVGTYAQLVAIFDYARCHRVARLALESAAEAATRRHTRRGHCGAQSLQQLRRLS